MSHTRRSFIKGMSAGAFGLTLGSHGVAKAAPAVLPPRKSRVSFVTGNNRRDMIYQAVKPFEHEIIQGIKDKQIIIKPNNVWDGNPLCATHPDAIRGLLDFLTPLTDQKIIIAESTASPKGTMFTFNEYGYLPLEREFNVRFVDLNLDSSTTLWITDNNRFPLDIQIIDTFLNPDNYIISLARMKTHDSVIATLSLKNMVMASPLNVFKDHPNFIRNQYEKAKMHQGGPKGINYNMFLVTHRVQPQFAIIDGFVGMEGNGPADGTPVEHGVAVAGPDVISVDRIGVELMGINYSDVGYLQWCSAAGLGSGDLSNIDIIGSDIKPHIITYKLHENIERQLQWKETL